MAGDILAYLENNGYLQRRPSSEAAAV